MLSSEAVDIGLFDGVMGSNVTEFQTELKEFISQVDGPKLIEPQAFLRVIVPIFIQFVGLPFIR